MMGMYLSYLIRFSGQYHDSETQYYYNYYRDYDPTLGRYLQSDPIGILQDYSDPGMRISVQLGLIVPKEDDTYLNSLYSYAENSPLSVIDIDGLRPVGGTDAQKKKNAEDGKTPENYTRCWNTCNSALNPASVSTWGVSGGLGVGGEIANATGKAGLAKVCGWGAGAASAWAVETGTGCVVVCSTNPNYY